MRDWTCAMRIDCQTVLNRLRLRVGKSKVLDRLLKGSFVFGILTKEDDGDSEQNVEVI